MWFKLIRVFKVKPQQTVRIIYGTYGKYNSTKTAPTEHIT